MANLNINLSGSNGLINKLGVDSHLTIQQPENKYIAGKGQMVQGDFNPFRKYGYMSPTTVSKRDITLDTGTLSNKIKSHAYDPQSNKLYVSDGESVYNTTSLDDTELTKLTDVTLPDYENNIDIEAFCFANDGQYLYVVLEYSLEEKDDITKIQRFTLSTPFDVDTAVYDDDEAIIDVYDMEVSSIQVSVDGENLYIFDSSVFGLRRFSMSEWKLITLADTGEIFSDTDVSGVSQIFGAHVQNVPDADVSGSSRYLITFGIGDTDGNTYIKQFKLNSSYRTWSLSSSSEFNSFTVSTTSQTNNIKEQIRYEYGANEGDSILVLFTQSGDDIERYTLSTQWDVSTATLDSSLTIPGGTDPYTNYMITEDGNTIYFKGESTQDIETYSLSTSYDLSTATLTSTDTFITNPEFDSILDIEIYTMNGHRSLYYVYSLTGSRDVFNIDYNVYDIEEDTFYKGMIYQYVNTDLSDIRDDEAFFSLSTNEFMYLLTSDKIYRIGGTELSGKYGSLQEMIEFTNDMYIDDVEDYREYIYIAIHRGKDINLGPNYSNECGVYVWARTSGTDSFRDYIGIPGAKRIAAMWTSHDGRLFATTINANDKGELREFKQNRFVILTELERNSYPVDKDSTTSGPNASWWIGNNGEVYAYGKINPSGANNIYKFGKLINEGDTPGMFFYGGESAGSVSGNNWDEVESFYFSYDDGSPQVKLWAPHANADGDYPNQVSEQGDVYTPVTYLPQMSTLKNIEIYCARTSLSDSTTLATLKFYINQSTTPFLTKTVKAEDAVRGYIDIALDKPFVNSFQMEVEWNNSLALSEDLFYPSQAIVRYEGTSTKG